MTTKKGLTFSNLDFEALQALLWPLIRSLTGFDVAAFLAQAPATALGACGNLLHQAGELFDVAAQGLADGRLTADEVNRLVGEADDLPGALRAIEAALGLGGGDSPEVPPDTMPTHKAPPLSDGLASPEYGQGLPDPTNP